jgi:outer membrane protein, multidrug efflux system
MATVIVHSPMVRVFSVAGALLAVQTVGTKASAQSAAPPPATVVDSATPTGLPTAAPPATDQAFTPPGPAVSDPMLAPVPPPSRAIASWDEAARLMRARSTDLRRAYDEVRRAEADSRTALAAVLPTLNGSVTASHTILPAAGSSTFVDTGATTVSPTGRARNTLNASLRLAVPLVDLRAWHVIGTAHRNEDLARLGHADLERTTAATLAAAIAESVTAERVAELGRVGLRNALERLALTEAKERTGTGTGLDIVRAKQDVAQARSSLVTSDESLRKARDALGLAVGFAEPVGVVPATSLESIESGALKACRSLPDLEHRPDLLAAKQQLEVSERRAHEVDLGFLPTLSASSTLAETVNDTSGAQQATWNVQAILSVPLWDGGVRYGARRSAAAVASQSLTALTALRRTSSVGLTQARRNVEVARESLRVAKEARDLAFEVDRLTRAGYQTGKGTSLDLVTSAVALRQAEVNLALKELGLVQARLSSLLTLATCGAS